jgi:hypothetical protein
MQLVNIFIKEVHDAHNIQDKRKGYLKRSITLPSSLDKRRTLLEGTKVPFQI